MNKIHLTQFIQAPVDRVYDLCRSLSLRKKSMNLGHEQVLSSSGDALLRSGETITLRAKHLGKTRELTARVTETKDPLALTEEQIKGDLKSFRRVYHFKPTENGTILIDILEFDGPRDLFGSLLGSFFLKSYFEKKLRKQHELVKQYAESENLPSFLL